MKIKLIAVDLDGTLLEDDHVHVSGKNKEVLKRAADQGIFVVIASGRTLAVLSGAARQVDGVSYALVSNGASAYKIGEQKALFLDGLSYEKWSRIFRILEEHHAVFEVYCNGKSYMKQELLSSYENPELGDEFIRELKSHLIASEDVLGDLKGQMAEKISVLFTPAQYCKSLEQRISEIDGLVITSSIPGNLEINQKGVNKGSGLKRLCDDLGIEADEVMAFGDANNDLEMLAWAKWSFAMKNGTKEAKKIARFTTEYSNMEDGVGHAVEKNMNMY